MDIITKPVDRVPTYSWICGTQFLHTENKGWDGDFAMRLRYYLRYLHSISKCLGSSSGSSSNWFSLLPMCIVQGRGDGSSTHILEMGIGVKHRIPGSFIRNGPTLEILKVKQWMGRILWFSLPFSLSFCLPDK